MADRRDPLVGFHFAVEVQGVVTGYFTECSGIGSEHEIVEHRPRAVVNCLAHAHAGRYLADLALLEHAHLPFCVALCGAGCQPAITRCVTSNYPSSSFALCVIRSTTSSTLSLTEVKNTNRKKKNEKENTEK